VDGHRTGHLPSNPAELHRSCQLRLTAVVPLRLKGPLSRVQHTLSVLSNESRLRDSVPYHVRGSGWEKRRSGRVKVSSGLDLPCFEGVKR
jgi:hypothetical protein